MGPQIVYLSGPDVQYRRKVGKQDLIAAVLESRGYQTYLPQRDGIEVGKLMDLLNDKNISAELAQIALAIVRRCVFALDMYQLIERCTCAVFNLDGRVPDDGSVVESQPLRMLRGKLIVTFKSTPVTFIAGQDNPMIEGLSYTWLHCTTVADIPNALERMIQKVGDTGYKFKAPPQLKLVIDVGREVADTSGDFRKILTNIIEAPPDQRLVKAAALLEWAKNSKAYQTAFVGKVSSSRAFRQEHRVSFVIRNSTCCCPLGIRLVLS